MVNFLRYAIRETATNLWRNRLMTMAAVLTVTVSLGLVGSALYLKQGAAQASASWERQTEVIVYMSATSTLGEHNAVQAELKQSPYVDQQCKFRSKRWDYYEAVRLLGVDAATLTPKTTPSSFRCTPAQPADAAIIVSEFTGAPGVFQVVSPQAEIHAIQTTVNWLQVALLVIALVLLLSASVLILNSIRMAIFARRREVSVMKLVGATNWFIRVPFIAEGMIQGLLGAFLASAWVYGIHVVVDNISNPHNPQSLGAQMRLTGWHVFMTDVVVVLIGALIGGIGSAFAVRRFLDV
ncbi:MAG TPA: permease-like cell division protein FtsX [Acidimicrobiales bacterium]|jgi:cell division transport system permease protein|nr:permease-like cell division protein FtsX [Acidimicrobiales bacterium]